MRAQKCHSAQLLVPFVSNDSSLSPKIFFLKHVFSLYSGALTSLALLKLNYLHLLIVINYPNFIRCVIANQLTGFYMSLFLTVKGTSDGMKDFDCQSFQFCWESQTCLFISNL